MVVDSSNKRRKKTITEEDTATLLQRYDATIILKLLQEIAYYAETKIDWCELVKKTTTGITNPREYQSLWRHLSYGDPLLPVGDDDDQPLDDDSDLECELEASPSLSVEASSEATAYVKVMAASYVPSDSDIPDDSIVEAPLTINIPCSLPEGTQEPSESPWSLRGKNITFPVCLQRATSTEGMNGNGSASSSMASRRKRIKWSSEEDAKLIAAVDRCGEGNWVHIVKGDFSGERTASQLSQRWALIKKRCHTSTSASPSVLLRTEEQIAVNHALSLALGNPPPSKKLAVGISPTPSSCGIAETQGNGGSLSQGQKQSKSVVQPVPQVATAVPASKSRVAVRKTTSKSDLMVTANSVAAAACMGLKTAALIPKVEPGRTDVVPINGPVTNGSKAFMPRPSSSFSMPKVEPGKSMAASATAKPVGIMNSRSLANGSLKPVTAASSPLASASKNISNQRVLAASIPAPLLPPKLNAETITRKPDGRQKEQAGGDSASSLVAIQPSERTSTNTEITKGKQATQAQSPNLLSRRIPVAPQSAVNQNLVDKPSGQTAIPSISGTDSQSNAKCEVNNKVGSMIKVSNVCGKSPEVATVGRTGQGV